MSKLEAVLGRVDAELDKSVERWFDFLRIPSISTDPEYAEDCVRVLIGWLSSWKAWDFFTVLPCATLRVDAGCNQPSWLEPTQKAAFGGGSRCFTVVFRISGGFRHQLSPDHIEIGQRR